uniref:Aromatic amino acid beta-eliminating lyase/threonine aldolase domain-containing protein n=1 Tax=Brassica oleracea var. oleracea TaxID=109376 RepID=A0A0D3DNH4_BRAOL
MVIRSVDLRSDTVTRPTDAMRKAMASAEVDDDILGYDPTARHLEEEMAKMTGKEAALFVPSGTMGNLICVMVHCEVRGSEKQLLETLKEARYPSTKLICLENTHANSGGRCLSAEYTDRVGEIAKRHGLKLHIDGARLFNASIALGVPVHRLVEAADSVSVCLSKGLGAPVGTVIVGSHTFIEKAKTLRKTLGGGMRQIGVLCAAALVALQETLPKLQFDHKKAKLLAEGLNQMKGIRINVAAVETNMIFMDMEDGSKLTAEKLRKSLTECGILVLPGNSSRIRMVIYHHITSDVHYTLSCLQQAGQAIHEPKMLSF